MIKRLICLLILAGWGICSAMSTEPVALEMNKKEQQMQVIMKTSMGDIRMELYEEKAPKTVANFFGICEEGALQ